MVKAKLITALVLVGSVIVVAFQNTQAIEAKYFFLTMTMPLASLLGIALLVGIAVGILLAFGLSGRKDKED